MTASRQIDKTALWKRRASLITQLVKSPPAIQETPVCFLGREDPIEKGQTTYSSILGLALQLSWERIHLQCRRPGFNPWVGKIPWTRKRLQTSVFWPGEFHRLYSPWGHKEADATEQLSLYIAKPSVKEKKSNGQTRQWCDWWGKHQNSNTSSELLLLLLLLSRFSRVQLCATPEMAAHQAPPSLGFSRQEHWSGLPFPSPTHESEKWKWSRSDVSDS